MRSGTIAFLIGIIVASYQQAPISYSATLLVALLLLCCLFILLYPKSRFILLIVVGFLWTLFRADILHSDIIPAEYEGKDITVEGTVVSIPEQRGHGVRFIFKAEMPYQISTRIRLYWYPDKSNKPAKLVAGQKWRLVVRLKKPRATMNSAGFDYEGWLFRNRLTAVGYVRHNPTNQKLSDTQSYTSLYKLRSVVADRLISYSPDMESAALLIALATGHRGYINQSQKNVLKKTGTYHLLAISGLHIALVAGAVFFSIRRVWSLSVFATNRIPATGAAATTAIIFAFIYMAISGFSIPTQRAFIMAMVALSGIIFKRHLAPGNILFFALLLVLMFDPFTINDPGFWLSFIAVTIIFIGMTGRLAVRNIWWKWGRIQWIMSIGLAPVLLFFFSQIPVISVAANLIAVPVVSFIVMPLLLFGSILMTVSGYLSEFTITLSAYGLTILWKYLQLLGSLPFSVLNTWTPGTWQSILASMGVIWLLSPRGIPGRLAAGFLLLPLFFAKPSAPAYGDISMTLLDVGQGLSAVIRTKSHTLVYDTGPGHTTGYNAGEAIVVPFLKSQGINLLDILVVSHSDNDHRGGVTGLLRHIKTKRLISSSPTLFGLKSSSYCRAGEQWVWDGVNFLVLHPSGQAFASDNDNSCVLRISNGEQTILLTGDIESRTERYLLMNRLKDLPASILVVPHHGSRTSSSPGFLDVVKPDIALFPIGYRNRFKFPHNQVLDRYKQRGIVSYDTGHHGAISVYLEKGGLARVETRRGDHRRIWHQP